MQFLALVAKCALALLCLLTVAVAQEDDSDSKTVFDIISDTPELSEFAQLVGSDTDAGKALRNPEESVTVFVPTDTAVKGTSNDWDPLYHIASRRVLFAKGPALELVATQRASPFSFDVIGVRRERGKNSVLYSNQNANVERADIVASNGVVHVIDKVLLNPLMLEETCDALGIAKFEASLRKIKLEGMVYWQPNRTTFVPTDEAMSKLPDDLDNESLRRILRHHSVPAGATPIPTGFDNTLKLVSDNDFDLQVVANDTGTFVNDARVSIANYIVREGIMNVIDSVITTGPVSDAKSGDGDDDNGGASVDDAGKEIDAENSSDGNTSSDSGGDSGGKLSPVVTAVITAVVAAVLGIVGKLGVVLYRRRKQKSNSDGDTSSNATDSPAPLISDKASGSYKALDEHKSRLSSDSSSVLDGARAELGVSATSNSQSAQPAADAPRIRGTGQPLVPSSTGQPMSSS